MAIRERELDLYTDNLHNIGAQAALLAGFSYSALTFEVMDLDAVCTMEKIVEGTPCAKDSLVRVTQPAVPPGSTPTRRAPQLPHRQLS